jgi:GrpB-like predicted nucleotidyltransferase (UPF0157 family)
VNLVADEGVDRPVVERLRLDGHEVVYVAELSPSVPDEEVLQHTTMMTIVPYQATWRAEFMRLGQHLRQHLDALALRIDHIGSTAVPGLAAKDIIDIQITAQELTPALENALNLSGYQRVRHITQDHLPLGQHDHGQDWRKWFFNAAPAQRPVNVHIRMPGRANQRYALAFRDYLRACPRIAQAYAQVKMALVQHHVRGGWDGMEGYYAVKDPVCDIIIGGAEIWAASHGWAMGPTDC